MTKNIINKALKMMGYRQSDLAKSERWCKPLGFTMLSCDVSQDGFVLCQWMMAYPKNPKLSLWCKVEKNFKDDSIETLDRCIETLCTFEEYDARAGFRRNQQMCEYADALIAITTGSSGTADMIERAKKKGLTIFIKEVN